MAAPSAQNGQVAQTLTGARAKIYINGKLIGLATDCNWSMKLGMEPVHSLGRYEPQEIVPTSQEAIDVSVNGMRVFNFGPHKGFDGTANSAIMVPVLKDLIQYKDIIISIFDRANPKVEIMRVSNARCTGYSSSVSAKGMMNLSMNFVGIRLVDEHTTDAKIQDTSASPYTIS